MVGIEPGGVLGIVGGGMAKGDAAPGLQGLHQLMAFGVVGHEAAHTTCRITGSGDGDRCAAG